MNSEKKCWKKCRKSNFIFLIVLFFIMIISIYNVDAKVTITDIQFNPVINEGEYVSIFFNASSNISEFSDLVYEIYLDGVQVGDTNDYNEKTDYSQSGSREYVIVVSDNESSDIDNVTIEVLDVPLLITINSPKNEEYNTDNITISLYVNQDADTTCDYIVSENDEVLQNDVLKPINSYNGSSIMRLFYGYVILPDGDYVMDIFCQNEFNQSYAETSFNIFSDYVAVLSKTYSITQNNGLILDIETDYDVECRYSLSDDNFSSMIKFSMTNNVMHNTIISGLSEGGHRVYFGCMASNGLITYDYLSVMISARPSASITIAKPNPLKQGIYELIMKTSKDVENSPSLYYVLDNDNTKRTVSLTGSGSIWKGYLIIDADIGNNVGAFKFSGVDFNGVSGDIITDGEIFLIDTEEPLQVMDLNVEMDENDVILSWFYDSDDFETFKIYRSNDGILSKKDFLDDTTDTQFIDKDVTPGELYTYSILAIDEAGNEGPFSDEMQIEIPFDENIYNNVDEGVPVVVKKLDPALYNFVDKQISETEIMLLDIESMQNKLDAITDTNALKIISLLDLDAKIKTAKSTTENILSQLADLKDQNLERADLEVRLNKLKLDAIKAQNDVVEELIVEEKGSFEQITQESDVESAITYIIEGLNISKSQLKEYIGGNKAIQDQIIVKTESISFKIRHLNQENYDKRTIIYKTLISSLRIDNVSIIETIPKEVENTASEIIYLNTAQPEIILEDPVIKWEYDSLESIEFYYMVDDIVPLTSLKNIRTVVLRKPSFTVGDNKITGMLSFETIALTKLSPIHWIIVIGIGMIFVLGAYYFVVLDKQDNDRVKKHKIIHNNGVQKRQISYARQSNLSQYKYPAIQPHSIQSNSMQSNNIQSNNIQSRDSQSRKAPSNTISSRSSNTYGANNYGQKPNSLDDKLPEVIIRKIDYCNSVINVMDYERARTLYNDTVKTLPESSEPDEITIKKLSHVKAKLDAYRHIHNARRHLYYKRLAHFTVTIKSLNECYGTIAHNIGFMQHIDSGSEVKFLNFVAENVKQLEKNREMLLKK